MLILIRSCLMFVFFILLCLVGIILGIFRPFNAKNTTLICKYMAWGLPLLGIKIIVHNQEALKLPGPFVYLSNHQSNFDIFPGSFLIQPNCVTIGKKSIKYIPFFGQFYWLAGNILIDRSNKKNAYSTMDETTQKIKEDNLSVWIMPEGTRSKGRGLLPFKKGAFVTAIKAQIPVFPIVISTYFKKLNFNKWHSGTIVVEVLNPIPTIGKSLSNVNDLQNQTYELMKSALLKIDHE